MQGLGSVQFFDQNGQLLTAGVLYSYQAGTTTQQATFTDFTGTIQNTNPIAFGAGARASIWLTSGALYKFVLCLQNDGPSCAPSDVLFSVDQVPGGASNGSGGGSSPFTGIFISSSSTPATSGILRLASGDTTCWRNAAGSANICWSKDSSDLLSWAGGSLKFPEVNAPSGIVGFDVIWSDNTAHRWKMSNNGGGTSQIVASGVDINTSDQVIQLHFGSTAAPISSTPPSTNQFLRWNGTQIVGAANDAVLTTGVGISGAGAPCGGTVLNCPIYILPNAHTLVRLVTNTSTAPSGCSPNATFGVKDLTTSTVLASITPTLIGTLDSGPISVPMPAGDNFSIGVTATAVGCSVFVGTTVTAVYN